MNTRILQAIEQSIKVKASIMDDTQLCQRIDHAAEMMIYTLQQGGKIHFCGNGGSAADAQHLAAELSGRFYFDRPPLNAEALHCNTSYITAVGNDYGFEHIFSRLMEGTGHKGDILVGLSTSGNSANIVKAYHTCKAMGIKTISLTGQKGGQMAPLSDILLNVPSTDTPRIQESHIMIGHILCELVETAMFGKK